MFYDLVQKLLYKSVKQQQNGGGKNVQPAGEYNNLSLFFTMLAIFIIKVLLVMISYNIVAPKVLEKWGRDPSKFRPLSFVECIFIVILFNNLFSRF